jgi:protein TonB
LLGSSGINHFLCVLLVGLFHLLVIAWLLMVSAVGNGDALPGVLSLSLIEGRHNIPSQKRSTPKLSATLSSSNERTVEEATSVTQDGNGYLPSASGGRVNRQITYGPKPHYPLISKQLKEQGLVVIKLCVSSQGLVEAADIFKSSGFQTLDRSALKTLSQWRFTQIDSDTAGSSSQCFQTPVQFTLEG